MSTNFRPPTGRNRKAMLKVIMLGSAGVGKTSLMNQFVNRKFVAYYQMTMGADFLTKTLKLDDIGIDVTLQIWDTVGQERFQSLGNAYYRGSDACILVYDITAPVSFRCLDGWRDGFLITANPQETQSFPFMLLGNKMDLCAHRQISVSKVEKWCAQRNNIPYFEVSAKYGTNLEEAFEALARNALERQAQENQQVVDYPDQMNLTGSDMHDGQSPKKAKRCGC